MDSFLVALGVVFLAELGDKTQLVILGLAARRRAGPVVAGALVAYAFTQGLSALAGGALGAVLPERAVAVGAGLLFLGFALWTLRGREEAGEDAAPRAAGPAVLSAALAVTAAELGDKTMLATAALAARQGPLPTWLGATTGIALAGLAAVVAGRLLGAHLPERAVRLASACLFAAFGLLLLVPAVLAR